MKEKRNYGIDLLKIILAILVITIHINANGTGKVLNNATEVPWKWIITFITMVCYPAVNTYVIITGYYSFALKQNLKSVVKGLSFLWLSAIFFSVFGYLISYLFFNNQFVLCEFVKRLFPIVRGVWWFYTIYFGLMLISPFINKLLESLSKNEHKLFLLIIILLMSIFPFFVGWEDRLGSNYGYSLIWFIALYCTGAFLKRTDCLEKGIRSVLRGGGVFFATTMIMVLFPKIAGIVRIQSTVAMYNSLICYIQAIALFIAFGNIRVLPRLERAVSWVSTLSLASYLFHGQEDVEAILWKEVHPSSYANSITIVWVSLGIIMAVFCVSAILECFRRKVCNFSGIDKCLARITERMVSRIEKYLKVD